MFINIQHKVPVVAFHITWFDSAYGLNFLVVYLFYFFFYYFYFCILLFDFFSFVVIAAV